MLTLCRLAGHPYVDKKCQLPNSRYSQGQQARFSFILGQLPYLVGQNLQFFAFYRMVCSVWLRGPSSMTFLAGTFPVGILQCHFREEPQTLSNFFQVFCQVVSCFLFRQSSYPNSPTEQPYRRIPQSPV